MSATTPRSAPQSTPPTAAQPDDHAPAPPNVPPASPHERGWFTVREAADELGMPADSVRMAIKRHTMHALTINSRLRVITLEELERYRRDHLGRRRKLKSQLAPLPSPTPETPKAAT